MLGRYDVDYFELHCKVNMENVEIGITKTQYIPSSPV